MWAETERRSAVESFRGCVRARCFPPFQKVFNTVDDVDNDKMSYNDNYINTSGPQGTAV